jgi:hypothetical protein
MQAYEVQTAFGLDNLKLAYGAYIEVAYEI